MEERREEGARAGAESGVCGACSAGRELSAWLRRGDGAAARAAARAAACSKHARPRERTGHASEAGGQVRPDAAAVAEDGVEDRLARRHQMRGERQPRRWRERDQREEPRMLHGPALLYMATASHRGSTQRVPRRNNNSSRQTWPMSGSPRGADFSPSQADSRKFARGSFCVCCRPLRGMPPTSRQMALAAAGAEEAERRPTSALTFPFAAHEHDISHFNHVRCPSRAAGHAEPWPVSDDSPTRDHAPVDACVPPSPYTHSPVHHRPSRCQAPDAPRSEGRTSTSGSPEVFVNTRQASAQTGLLV